MRERVLGAGREPTGERADRALRHRIHEREKMAGGEWRWLVTAPALLDTGTCTPRVR